MQDESAIQNLCLHTHNIFCDGKQDINVLIKQAVNQKVAQIGISSHAPIKITNKWSMDIDKLDFYTSEIAELKKVYKSKIEIFTALEIDFIPHLSYPFDYFRRKMKLDYTIGSIHLVKHPSKEELWFIDGDKKTSINNMQRIFDGDVRLAVQSFYVQSREMIRTQKPDIIGHMDKVIMNTAGLFDVNEPWYQEEIDKTLNEILKQNVIVEVNTRGIYKGKWKESFPSFKILEQCCEMGIPITISSDAHHSDELLLAYPEMRQKLKEIGFKSLKGLINNKWGNFPI